MYFQYVHLMTVINALRLTILVYLLSPPRTAWGRPKSWEFCITANGDFHCV